MPKHILIVDDDATFFKAYREIFPTEGFILHNAATGQEGLTLARTVKPDLILLDIMLPGGMNGFDVLEQLKGDPSTQHIPVIVITNLDSEAKVAKTIGAADYLVKANTPRDQIIKIVLDHLPPASTPTGLRS